MMPLNAQLYKAAEKGELSLVNSLLEQGAEINYQNFYRSTPLHAAARSGHTAVVNLLIEKGATLDGINEWKATPLHEAAKGGYAAIVAALIDKGANYKVGGFFDDTPFHTAAKGGHTPVINVLINKGIQLDIRNQFGDTPLRSAAARGYQEIVTLLLNQEKSLIHCQNKGGITPLHGAVAAGDGGMITLLLSRGAIISAHTRKSSTGIAPLHIAIGNERRDLVTLLLQRGAYSYLYKQRDLLSRYWEEVDANTLDSPFYTTLLLSGASMPPNQRLSNFLVLQQAIQSTMSKWLKPLNLPEQVVNEVTPYVLRALPRLLNWLRQCQAAEVATKEILEIKDVSEMPVLPTEIWDEIRSTIIRKALVINLGTIYPIPRGIFEYLVAEVVASPTACKAFLIKLFQHNWPEPCEPPTTQWMNSYRQSYSP